MSSIEDCRDESVETFYFNAMEMEVIKNSKVNCQILN